MSDTPISQDLIAADRLERNRRALLQASQAVATAIRCYEALRSGKVATNGATAALVTQNLNELRRLIAELQDIEPGSE